jgi:riboflavin kinase/FMN adenylyltransferase
MLPPSFDVREDHSTFARENAMEIWNGIDGLRQLRRGSVLSIGNFDGLHLGHQKILETARTLRDASPGSCLAVVTFEPHPLTVLRPQLAPPRLTTPVEKQAMLQSLGVDDYVILPPTREVLNLEAEAFWAILRDEVKPTALVEGGTFNFGKNRRGSIERLKEWSAGTPIELRLVDSVTVTLPDMSVVDVSSSLIRWLIAYGRVRDAAICLGRPYALTGEVIHGNHRGRTIGVPTANLKCEDVLIPADGVYAGRCTIDGKPHAAAVSIGTNPTFRDRQRSVEAHLIGFSGDLYGRTIRVELLDWLRDQWKYNGVEPLKKQLSRDLEETLARQK